MMKLSACLVLSLAAAAGCTVTTHDEISSAPLGGYVGGQSWSFSVGHTNDFLSEGEPDFFATLYPSAFTTCGFSEPAANHLIVSIPKTPGDYTFDLGLNMTIVDGDRNLITTDGRIVVDEVTATRVRGGLVGYYDFDNEVNGQFDIAICAE